jgi:hypothetical protein
MTIDTIITRMASIIGDINTSTAERWLAVGSQERIE